jgi:hypothetical protein
LVYDDEREEQRNPGHGRGLVWLVGMDGNDTATGPQDADKQGRMLARRRDPVVIPAADQTPSGVPDPYNDGTERR